MPLARSEFQEQFLVFFFENGAKWRGMVIRGVRNFYSWLAIFWLGPKQAGIQHTGDGLVGLGGFGEGGIFPNATQASYSPSKYSRAYISRS